MLASSQDSCSTPPITPPTTLINRSGGQSSVFLEAALAWYRFGLGAIPIWPGGKATSVRWDAWLRGLSEKQIIAYWSAHPAHQVGFIVGEDLIIFDADAPEAIKTITCAEKSHDVKPAMIVKTKRGQHHYFRRAQGTFAKSDSHSTEAHPERIDVKTGRSMVILPPSPGKFCIVNQARNADELSLVDQAFIDSIWLLNDRQPPRPPQPRAESGPHSLSGSCGSLVALLANLNPDCGYADWLRALAAIFHETGGAEDGLALADAWSSAGVKYDGPQSVRKKWYSFSLDHPNPCTFATLCWLVRQNGGDPAAILAALELDLTIEGAAQ